MLVGTGLFGVVMYFCWLLLGNGACSGVLGADLKKGWLWLDVVGWH